MLFLRKATVILLVAVLAIAAPFSASAAWINPNDLLDTTGVIRDMQENSITTLINGAEHTYYKEDAVNPNGLLSIGDTVKIYFLPEDPDTAVQITLIAYGSKPPAVQHTHYSVTGPITDATTNTITVLKDGRYRTFSKEDAKVIAPNGILLGDTVKIVYNAENPQVAVQIVMVAHGNNHENVPPQTVTHYSVTGPITDATTNTITVLKDGKYRTFGKEDAKVIAPDGILLGDTVQIIYHKDNPQLAVQIKMVKEGYNH